MAIITVTGEPGCRVEESARLAAQRLEMEFLGEPTLRRLIAEEFGEEISIPERAYLPALQSVLARLATSHHLVVYADGAEMLMSRFPAALRIALTAPEGYRLGAMMLEKRLERDPARAMLRELEREQKTRRKKRTGRLGSPPHLFDLVCNVESLSADEVAGLIAHAAIQRGLTEEGLLPETAEVHLQFEARLQLARHRISPAGRVNLTRKPFAHHSEEIFANLLDFYRIAWEYEQRSFPIQWGKDGRPTESFTPDFYLPELDLYIEITTMKQAHVTRKNRKVKLLKTIYPNINIQVFYQKDFQNLIFKYGLAERPMQV
jgi:cytidylate kinase